MSFDPRWVAFRFCLEKLLTVVCKGSPSGGKLPEGIWCVCLCVCVNMRMPYSSSPQMPKTVSLDTVLREVTPFLWTLELLHLHLLFAFLMCVFMVSLGTWSSELMRTHLDATRCFTPAVLRTVSLPVAFCCVFHVCLGTTFYEFIPQEILTGPGLCVHSPSSYLTGLLPWYLCIILLPLSLYFLS